MFFSELHDLLHLLDLRLIVVSLGLSIEIGQLCDLPHILLWLVDVLVLDGVVSRAVDLWFVEECVEAVEDIGDC